VSTPGHRSGAHDHGPKTVVCGAFWLKSTNTRGPRSSFHHSAVTRSGRRRASSRATATAAARTSTGVQWGSSRTYTWMPRQIDGWHLELVEQGADLARRVRKVPGRVEIDPTCRRGCAGGEVRPHGRRASEVHRLHDGEIRITRRRTSRRWVLTTGHDPVGCIFGTRLKNDAPSTPFGKRSMRPAGLWASFRNQAPVALTTLELGQTECIPSRATSAARCPSVSISTTSGPLRTDCSAPRRGRRPDCEVVVFGQRHLKSGPRVADLLRERVVPGAEET
jgi:hypothetical protein